MSFPVPPTTANYPPAKADPASRDPAPEPLARLAALPVATVPGCNGAAVTLAGVGAPFSVTETSQPVPAVHQAQYRSGDGPCLTALLHLDSTAPGSLSARSRRARPGLIDRETLNRPTGQGRPPNRAAERRLAQASHNSLLPRALPSVPGLVCAARYLPSGQAGSISGDWYDLFALPDGAFAVSIGDVMGHDAAEAAQMGQLRGALRAYAYLGSGPAQVLDQLDALVQGLDMAPLATVLYGRLVLDQDGALLRYGNAGHPPPLVRHPDGTVSQLTGAASCLIGAPSCGLPVRSETAVHLPAGSTLLLYTDGLIESRVHGHRQDPDESLDRLTQLIADLPTVTGPAALCKHVTDELVDSGHDDDIALLALQIIPQDPR